MEKLKELMELCKGSVSIDINPHRDCYETILDHLSTGDCLFGQDEDDEDYLEEKEILEEMIKRNEMVRVYAYPNTPVSFFRIIHYDLETAVDMTLEAVRECVPTPSVFSAYTHQDDEQ